MAVYQLQTFTDIVTAVREELKIQSADTESIKRIKRNINIGYTQEVVPYRRWKWLNASIELTLPAVVNSGTAAVTQNSATVTLSVAPSATQVGKWFSLVGSNERYRISAHTAATTTLTLESVFVDATDAAATYQIWTDKVDLPADCRETVEVSQDNLIDPMEGLGYQEFQQRANTDPKLEARPTCYYTSDPVSDVRELFVYPAIYSTRVTLHVSYTKRVDALEDDSDEPLIPLEDRVILLYWALADSWTRERNPEEAGRNLGKFQRKLDRMAGKKDDSIDKPRFVPSIDYLKTLRRGSRRRRSRNDF